MFDNDQPDADPGSTLTVPGDADEPVRLRHGAIEPQDWMPSLRREYATT